MHATREHDRLYTTPDKRHFTLTTRSRASPETNRTHITDRHHLDT
ncbi:hypothetical protein ACIPSJ_51255 [Streptomyces sp. NPDC090088]